MGLFKNGDRVYVDDTHVIKTYDGMATIVRPYKNGYLVDIEGKEKPLRSDGYVYVHEDEMTKIHENRNEIKRKDVVSFLKNKSDYEILNILTEVNKR